jgi:ABC-type sugar transport system permease subunit
MGLGNNVKFLGFQKIPDLLPKIGLVVLSSISEALPLVLLEGYAAGVPGISTGITMVFVPAVSTFVISRMLGGGSNLLIGDLIELQFLGNSYNLNLGSAMSLVLMVIVLLCMSFTSSFDESEMEGVM